MTDMTLVQILQQEVQLKMKDLMPRQTDRAKKYHYWMPNQVLVEQEEEQRKQISTPKFQKAFILMELPSIGMIFEELTSRSFVFAPFLSTFRRNDIVSGVFLSPKELFWDDPTGCVDKTKEFFQCPSIKNNDSVVCKALSTIYPGLYDFFLNVCGVPKNPSFGSYLQMLLQLSSIAPPSQASHAVFQVFLKWADDLKSGSVNSGEIIDLKENLHKLENTVLPTLLDKWVSLHPSFGLICWSDDDELKQQFKHFDGVDFLHFGELSKEDQEKLSGRIATFMHEIGVPALSEVVSREAVFYGMQGNKEKTSLINWVLPYAQRYLYKLYPDIYSNMKQLGLENLTQLQVVVVEKLFYKNCLRGRGGTLKKRFECSCLLQGGTLYTTLTADSHSIFLELSRLFFNGSTELHFANFLHMVTTMAESGSTSENILNSQKIPVGEYPMAATVPYGSKKYVVGEYPMAATVNNPNLEASSKTKNELNDSVLFSRPERDRLCYQTHYDDNQFWKTGRLREAIAYNFFISKLGPENVKWVNEGNETGLPYDLIIGVDESSKEYIEVKATRSATKD